MYGKLFESIYDGTLVEDWRALITFQQMIILCDSDGILDMTVGAISRRTGIPQEHIKHGVTVLEAPDVQSRTPDEEGKRIVRIDDHRAWGWRIVNHKYYRDLRTKEDRREYMRNYMREKRSKQKLTKDNDSSQLAELANADTNTNTNIETKNLSSRNKFSNDDFSLAKYIEEKIRILNPNAKSPNSDKWANEIRLMREIDKREHTEIKRIFDWANRDPFWRSNILSPAKLRKQFDQLTIKASSNGPHQQDNRSRAKKVSDELDKIAAAAIERGETF